MTNKRKATKAVKLTEEEYFFLEWLSSRSMVHPCTWMRLSERGLIRWKGSFHALTPAGRKALREARKGKC